VLILVCLYAATVSGVSAVKVAVNVWACSDTGRACRVATRCEAIQIRAAEETAAREQAERKAAEAQAAEAAYWAYWNNYTTTQMAIFNAETAETEEDPENNFGGGDDVHFITDMGGCPNVHDPCHSSGPPGNPNEGASSNCRDRQTCPKKPPAGGSPWEPADAFCLGDRLDKSHYGIWLWGIRRDS
jgi:hypothetical protein